MEKLDRMTDEIHSRFGYFSIQRSFMKQDEKLSCLDAGTHTVHPVGYFHGYYDGSSKKVKDIMEHTSIKGQGALDEKGILINKVLHCLNGLFRY